MHIMLDINAKTMYFKNITVFFCKIFKTFF